MTATRSVQRAAVRPLRPADDIAIRRLFDDTVLLGCPVDQPIAEFDEYRQLSLGWYLGPGRDDAAVAVGRDGEIVGYALVCTDEPAAERWAMRHGARLVRRLAGRALRLRIDAPSRRFYLARARDGWTLWRRRSAPVAPAHAHLNVAPGRRDGTATLALFAHIDDRCRRAGVSAWYGEINERPGRRAAALERRGLEIVRRDPNHTLSELLGTPVERLTIRRRLADV